MNARLRPIRSAILLPIRMNAAETRASSAIADWTPLAVVSRSLTTAEIDTFISEVSTTRTNIAIARRIASVWSPLDSADVAGTAGALTGRVSGAARGRASPSLDERVARARAGSLRHEEGAPDAEHLGHRPRLERAACRLVRCRPVGRLRDRAEPPLTDVRVEAIEDPVERHAHRARCIDVRPDQPGPHGACVVGGVPLGRPAAMERLVPGVFGREGPKAERREQRASTRVDCGTRCVVIACERRIRKRDREQLVRPYPRVVSSGAVHDVVQPAAVR